MLGFLFGGVNSSTYGVYLKQGGEHVPLLPPTKERRVKIAGMDGEWDYGATWDSLPINLDCFIVQPTGLTDLVSQAYSFAALLDPHLGAQPLVLPDRPGYYLARYAGSLDFVPAFVSVEFTVPFICTNPVRQGL